MVDLKGFRLANNLTQGGLGEYLGIQKSFVSQIEHGLARLPKDKLTKLLDNEEGWDTSMLIPEETQGDNIQQTGGSNNIGKIAGDCAAELLSLRKENEMLRLQLEEAKALNAKYWDMLEKLMSCHSVVTPKSSDSPNC